MLKSLGIPHLGRSLPPELSLLIDETLGLAWNAQITEPIASDIHQLDRWSMPILSIDLPSGLRTDTEKC